MKEQREEVKHFEQDKKFFWLRALSVAGLTVITACVIIVFYFAIERFDGLREGINTISGILRPFVIGFVMAFLINPIMKFLERRIRPFMQRHSKTPISGAKVARTICSILGLLIFVGIISVFLMIIIPEMYTTVMFLIDNITEQIAGVLDWANQITGGRFEKEIMGVRESGVEKAIENGVAWLREYLDLGQENMISMAVTGAYSIGKLFVDLIIAMIVSVYILCSKETFRGQTKKILYAIFPVGQANVILEIIRKTNDIFYGFIVGKIIDSTIIGVICYVSMLILKMPYPMLVSVIIGVTNVIPVFGPYIGAVPTVIIIFLTNPMQGIYFLIFVFILQQIDGNIIGPKILGDSTGLSSFWVVFAIVVGGGLFGFMGMVVAVPTMAVIYYLAGRFVKYLLRRRNLPEATDNYVELKKVNAGSNEIELNVTEEVAVDQTGAVAKFRDKLSQKKK